MTFLALEILAVNSESTVLSSCLGSDTSLLYGSEYAPNPLCATIFFLSVGLHQEAKVSEIQINQRNFFLTFGPVIRKLFTDLEERKTTEHNGDAPTHFCCQEL